MHIPQDIVDLIVDQLSLSVDCEAGAPGHLQAPSLVSSAWVNRSQHHLFSTLEFDDSWKIKRWCSRIKPNSYGVSRHVRVLIVGWRDPFDSPTSLLKASDITTALPHFTSLKNLQEFILGLTFLGHTSLGVLSPILSSSVGTLKRLGWIGGHANMRKTWEEIRTLTELLPNLTHVVDLSDGTQIRFSADEGHSPAVKRFTFHELRITDIALLSLPFFESRGPHLQVLDLKEFEVEEASKR